MRCCSNFTNKATQVPGTRLRDTSLSNKANYYHPNVGRRFNTFGSFNDFLKFLRVLERDMAGELVKQREQASGDGGHVTASPLVTHYPCYLAKWVLWCSLLSRTELGNL